ncbi:MAG: ABC transporter permease, partial [Gammaproteobacteria bacterium]|nr:ABC transporter permease [Gammaproteobacteria bacterium]
AGAGGDLTDAIKDGGSKVSGSREERRWGSALIIAEVAMTVVLILASTLLIRSFISLNQVDYGFKTENMLRMAQFVDRSDVPENELLPAHYARIKEIVKAQPGVEDVAITLPPIPSVNPIVRRATYAGMPEEEIENGTRVHFHLVGPDFFNVMEIPVVAGRPIALSDTSDTALVAVINENFAERFGGAAKALGQMIRMDAINTSAALREGEFRVVGVASHAHFYGPRRMANDELQIYLPYNQVSSRVVTLNVVANTDTQILAESLPRALAAQAPSSATDWVDDVEEFIRWTFNDTQFYTWLVIVFALSATLLMVVGLYAVLSQMVIRSIGEIGVRKSLGATYEHILFRYLKKSLAVVALGLAIGLGLSLLIANSMRSLLFGVSAFDPLAFVVTSLVLLLVAAAASLLPARRAAKVDPLEALRYE